ncbi:BTAD domain-containing putative transcriptional regulator [Rhizobium straminoryzae]|uniref:SARP family transcriptional regulator n=1 Tax=Rhizobium straminoryzae TaxID=1387186 RepID=A0A549SRN2_9HYPH|nr:BTAD domain-containing putative transcriptional regulator [Rhizobium straminoryzae]TRL32271.1 SARP family transcriptional regulator [Rhizobium straminoryzae]
MAGHEQGFTISLLGIPRCHLERDGFFPAKGFVLVAALLLAPGRVLTRQAAALLLWEDADQKRALGNLRQLLSRLQPFAEGDEALIEATPGGLAAGPLARRSDLSAFLDVVGADDVALRLKVLRGIGGELLQGVDADQEQFHLWLLAERARLKDLFFAATARLLEDMTRFGARPLADIAALAETALRLEDDREETYRMVISAYARAGDAAAAERMFDKLNQRLKLDGVQPEAATLALMRRLRSHAAPAESPEVQPEPARTARPRVAFLPPVASVGGLVPVLARAFIEDVANSLVRYRTFTVLAPHSSFAAAADETGALYQSLRANYRVQSLLLDEARLSLTLVENATAEILWSVEVALDEGNAHAAFRLLSKQIAAALAEQIERLQIDLVRSHAADAYRHLLAGQHMLGGKCDLPILRRARSEFRKAVDLDSGMAVARARIAQTLQLEWLMLGGGDPHLLHRAKAEAEAAVDLDPASGIGHWMCAVVALYRRDFDTSAEKFFEAEALAPNSADLLLQHADALAHFGQSGAAWLRFQQSIDLNPLAPDIYWWAGASIAFKLEDYAESVRLCRRMQNDEPALRVLTASLALSGDLEEAQSAGERLQQNYPGMTAKQISGLSPDQDVDANERFCHALRLAGLK